VHHPSNMFRLNSHRRRVRPLNLLTTWVMLLAVVGSVPAAANAHYVCSMGMAQAGPIVRAVMAKRDKKALRRTKDLAAGSR
jgi:hypothetical protein